jgi:small subunit ribosomal protein S1
MSDITNPLGKIPLSDIQPKKKLTGKVTRIDLSGAFVDVGAEKEGWLHISAMGTEKVNRVQDALQIGQEITTWVRKVDAGKGELQLTMVEPLAYDWGEIRPGITIHGKVTRIEKFGVFLDFGAERPGLIHISEFSNEFIKDIASAAKIGDEKDAVILDVDRKKRQVHLSSKALEAKPAKPVNPTKPTYPAKPAQKEEPKIAEELEIPTVTTMEAAFLEAQSGNANSSMKKTGRNRMQMEKIRQQQEDIFQRTLQTAQRK